MNALLRANEEAGKFHSFPKETPAIAAQIQDQALHLKLLELLDQFLNILAGTGAVTLAAVYIE